MKTEAQVLAYEKTGDKPGAWLKLKTIDDKGTARDAYVKAQNLIPLIDKPGFYEFTKEKNGKFWDIVGVKFIKPLGEVTATSNGHPVQVKSGTVDPNVLIQNRAITAQVCVKAAAELLGKALDNGAFKLEGGVVDTGSLSEHATILARLFMAEAKEFVTGKPEVKEPETPAAAPEGA